MYPYLRRALAVLALCATGCAGSGKENVNIPDPRNISGENREWWDIYSVEIHGDQRSRNKVGYLYRKFSKEDPRGRYWVKDLGMRDVGFLLDENQAFQIQPPSPGTNTPRSVPVGTTDLLGGIKRILQVPGTVVIEKVALEKTAPRVDTGRRVEAAPKK